MPIYMDLHIIPGVKAEDVASAHLMDLKLQKQHSCKCMTYWIDEQRGHVFCLIEAPHQDVVTKLHGEAHGLVPHKIIEVQADIVETFLGRVRDPDDAQVSKTGLKLINDPSYRYIVLLKLYDNILLRCQHGKEKADQLSFCIQQQIQKGLRKFHGTETAHTHECTIASFVLPSEAIAFARFLNASLDQIEASGYTISISAGEPVEDDDQLFGNSIRSAERMCHAAPDKHIKISSNAGLGLLKSTGPLKDECLLSAGEELLLQSLLEALESTWQDTEFDMVSYSQDLAMSRSQLYRKTLALCGLTPNALLKKYRLEKAKDVIKKKNSSIAQVTYSSGFSSPSYFTKCFREHYGILPMTYISMID